MCLNPRKGNLQIKSIETKLSHVGTTITIHMDVLSLVIYANGFINFVSDQMMEVDTNATSDWPGRWTNISKILERRGPLTPPSFQPSPDLLPFLLDNISTKVWD